MFAIKLPSKKPAYLKILMLSLVLCVSGLGTQSAYATHSGFHGMLRDLLEQEMALSSLAPTMEPTMEPTFGSSGSSGLAAIHQLQIATAGAYIFTGFVNRAVKWGIRKYYPTTTYTDNDFAWGQIKSSYRRPVNEPNFAVKLASKSAAVINSFTTTVGTSAATAAVIGLVPESAINKPKLTQAGMILLGNYLAITLWHFPQGILELRYEVAVDSAQLTAVDKISFKRNLLDTAVLMFEGAASETITLRAIKLNPWLTSSGAFTAVLLQLGFEQIYKTFFHKSWRWISAREKDDDGNIILLEQYKKRIHRPHTFMLPMQKTAQLQSIMMSIPGSIFVLYPPMQKWHWGWQVLTLAGLSLPQNAIEIYNFIKADTIEPANSMNEFATIYGIYPNKWGKFVSTFNAVTPIYNFFKTKTLMTQQEAAIIANRYETMKTTGTPMTKEQFQYLVGAARGMHKGFSALFSYGNIADASLTEDELFYRQTTRRKAGRMVVNAGVLPFLPLTKGPLELDVIRSANVSENTSDALLNTQAISQHILTVNNDDNGEDVDDDRL